jgi:quercetin dioxygenase-like cupin family protein
MSGRRVISVADLTVAIDEHEAIGFRLTTISPADDPRRADMDGPEPIRLERSADASPAVGRAGMVYRDLIPGRLGGAVIASHISIPEGGLVPDYVHHHDIRFQMIFCHAGWVKVVYEDQGDPFVMWPGDCVIQPPGIRHRVLESSDGLEVVEIGAPAEHDTHREHELELPNGAGNPDRAWQGQRFLRHEYADDRWTGSPEAGWELQHFGVEDATGGVAAVRLARTTGAVPPLRTHDLELFFGFVRSGELDYIRPSGVTTVGPGEAVVVPAGEKFALGARTQTEMLIATLPASESQRSGRADRAC